MSGVKWKHWCPVGKCGKKVVYTGERKLERHFECQLCGRRYKKEELI